MLKMRTYGFLRFVLPMFPDATAKYANWMIALAVIGIIYGALVAWVQPDMKKLVAYSSVSHLGFCVLGIFALNQTSIEGSILQMVNHGLSTGALFLLVGVVYERRHTRLLADYGGIARTMPIFAVCFVIAMLSSVGLPGLNGFVGEFLILAGSFKTHPAWTIVAASGVILAAIYLLWLVQRVFYGPITNEENRHIPDIAWNELTAVAALFVFIVWIGIHPNTFLRKMSPSVDQILRIAKQETGDGAAYVALGGERQAASGELMASERRAGSGERTVAALAPSRASLANKQITARSEQALAPVPPARRLPLAARPTEAARQAKEVNP